MTSDVTLPLVLFVDDDERLLESLRIVLRREPYRIVTATSTDGARRVLADGDVDVIVCDERLPTQNGTVLLGEMRAAGHPAIRIVLTGAGVPAAQRAVNEAAVFRFLAKPCSSKMIGDAVRDALEERRESQAPRPTGEGRPSGRYRVMNPGT